MRDMSLERGGVFAVVAPGVVIRHDDVDEEVEEVGVVDGGGDVLLARRVSSAMKSSHALEKTTGASPEIILAPPSAVSPAERFMIFLMRASGSACGPVRADTPPQNIPEYGLACLIFSFSLAAAAC
nr:unnamed protein product [Digitaria exilis]